MPRPPTVRHIELRDFERAAALSESFTGHRAEPLARVNAPSWPRVALLVGTLDGVLYTAVRDGQRGRYIHEFARRDRPLLLATPSGDQLLIYGGAYDFTERGIVDRSDRR